MAPEAWPAFVRPRRSSRRWRSANGLSGQIPCVNGRRRRCRRAVSTGSTRGWLKPCRLVAVLPALRKGCRSALSGWNASQPHRTDRASFHDGSSRLLLSGWRILAVPVPGRCGRQHCVQTAGSCRASISPRIRTGLPDRRPTRLQASTTTHAEHAGSRFDAVGSDVVARSGLLAIRREHCIGIASARRIREVNSSGLPFRGDPHGSLGVASFRCPRKRRVAHERTDRRSVPRFDLRPSGTPRIQPSPPPGRPS